MSSPSNIYAEKVYSEHPIALWALDDQLDYISFIDDSVRDMTTSWTPSTSSDDISIEQSFSNIGQRISSGLYKITATKKSGEDLTGIAKVTKSSAFSLADLNQDLATFSIGSYFYSDTEYISSIELGFTYTEEITNQKISVSRTFSTTVYKNWIYIAESFDIPNFTSDVDIFINIQYYDSQDPETEYAFYVNGLSIGQWAEEFQSESLGLEYAQDGSKHIVDMPSDISLYGVDRVVRARAYGLQDSNGYYILDANTMFVKNSGMPLVFGANNTTKLQYNSDLPSLIIPGNGFLNKIGKFSNYTFESWIRIDSISAEMHRIFGPINSLDGVYVDNERFFLKLSDNVASATIPEWGIPMLMHVKYINGTFSLMINAEELIKIDFDPTTLFLPSQYDTLGKSQDWLGFYAADDVSIDLDCVGIYPYDVDKTLAKRRWVYGQNVEYPENLNTAYDGKTVAIDYSSANYAGNFSFPRTAPWASGILQNIGITNNNIESPQHKLPDVILESGSTASWFTDQSNNNYEPETYVKLKPTSSWETVDGYFYLDNINFIGNDARSIYGIFKNTQISSSEQMLIKIRNKNTGYYFSITTSSGTVKYNFFNGISESTIKTVSSAALGEMFVAGIDMNSLSSNYGGELLTFFSNRNYFELFIAGDNTFTKTYLGNVYSFSIDNYRNTDRVAYMFNSDGTVADRDSFENITYDAGYAYFGNNSDYWSAILDGGDPNTLISDRFFSHVATYKVSPRNILGKLSLDVEAYSTWEDFVPLSNLAKRVKDSSGSDYYDLDFIQFNIGFPSPGKFVAEKTLRNDWTYAELQAEYVTPVQYTYAELDNELFSGYSSYKDLQTKTKTQYAYDTSNYSVKTYVTFQTIESGANNRFENYINTETVSSNNLVKAGDEWVNTKYQVIDGTVIYPPKSIAFSKLAIVVHVEMTTAGVVTKPSRVTNIQLSSQALDSSFPTPIGTKFGIPLYPYTKSGIYFNYKEVNPFKIYKRSTPYLFLNKNSGIELVGDYEPLVNRGLTVPLNSRAASKFDVAAVQVLMKYSKDFFPYASTPIFEIQSKDAYIKFYIVATHPTGKRAKIYAINSITGLEENGIAFYINGKLVKNPTLSLKEWAMIGISFAEKLNLAGYAGAFRINGPVMVNHLSYYQSNGLQEKIFTRFRIWDRVKETLTNQNLAWNTWKGNQNLFGNYTWNNVLVIGKSSSLGISLPELFKAYVGTNKIIFDDNYGVRVSGYRFRTYRKTSSVSIINKPS